MKKYFILTILGIVLIAAFVVATKNNKIEETRANPDFLRIHIRANSNNEEDQNVKLKVKEKVVEFLSPKLASCTTQQESKAVAIKHLNEITEIANKTLKENGFNYSCNAQIRAEEFPTRSYGNITLENGVYDALILELGSGSGNNWWCVMFPPLCFIGEENENSNIVYKSKIWDIIKKYS